MDFVYTGGEGCPDDYSPGARCPGQTDREYVSEFTMWTVVASSIVFATDPRNMSAIQKTVLMNQELLAIHQDPAARAGGRIGYWDCTEEQACQLWARPVHDGYFAVLYNAGEFSHDITLQFAKLDPSWSSRSAQVRDVWAHTDRGVYKGSFTDHVHAHGVVAVKLKLL